MEWLDRLNEALRYIEDNMTSDIDIEKLARITCCSSYHFMRMFPYVTGVTLAEYIRRRRLTIAAYDLQQNGGDKVIDLALKYGYDSPDAFTRAFQKLHGITPKAAREPGVKLKAFPRLSFQISVKGDDGMDYKIVDKPAFKVIGKGIRVTTDDSENSKILPEFWGECYKNGFCARLEKMSGKNAVTGVSKLGVCIESSADLKEFTYLIGVENTEGNMKGGIPEGFTQKEIPAASWVIFESIGSMPDAIQNLNKRIYSEWFPSTGFERDGDLDIEVYPPGNVNDINYRCEIWIPIKRKK